MKEGFAAPLIQDPFSAYLFDPEVKQKSAFPIP
jgi:hypothetical protein